MSAWHSFVARRAFRTLAGAWSASTPSAAQGVNGRGHSRQEGGMPKGHRHTSGPNRSRVVSRPQGPSNKSASSAKYCSKPAGEMSSSNLAG